MSLLIVALVAGLLLVGVGTALAVWLLARRATSAVRELKVRPDDNRLFLARANDVHEAQTRLGALSIQRFSVSLTGVIGSRNQGALVDLLVERVLAWSAEHDVVPTNVDLAVASADAHALVLFDPAQRGQIAAQVFCEHLVGFLGSPARERLLSKALARVESWAADHSGTPRFTSTGLSRSGAFVVVWYEPAPALKLYSPAALS
ncbi:MAG: hypothetical protein KDD82_12665 [Planctomycetes bacterium]|nr:hypothetical protein [Planctomycetota bacterium]